MKSSRKLIRGAGGGGKGGGDQHVASEAPDSLRSIQYARIIDVVSEGEIEGLVNGLKSVYLDDTPVQNPDGSSNFSGVTLVTRNGTQAQGYVPGFPAVEAETAVSTEVTAVASVTRSISNTNVNAIRVTVSVPQLTFQDAENGDISGTAVGISIDVQANGGGFVEQLTDTIAGKTTSRYQRSYRIELTGSTPPWDVRVRRLTPDSVQANLVNKTYWESYTEIIDAKLSYPNTALVALSVSAEQFKGIPKRGYEIKGIRVKIPSNYNPTTRVYTGVWDGTFTVAWTDNPAWCFYDIVINDRYGLGKFVEESQIDKWVLYEIAQYCDVLVPNGYGSTEPRFTCNLYLQTREEAYRVIVNFASIFRSIVYWSSGSITAVQDAPSDPVAIFTAANVIDGKFTYSGSSIKTRHTVVLVSWNDPEDRYRQKIEYVEDVDGIERYGVLQSDIVAMGCTSRGQAHRIGKWLLFSERMETETVSFRAGLDGVLAAPGQIIKTADPARAGVRMGGRITTSTTTIIGLDNPVDIDGAQSYTLWCVLADGTVESRAVTTPAGTSVNALTVGTAFTSAPLVQGVWVLASTNVEAESWRVINVAEVDKTQLEFSALAYRPDKYDAVEQDLILEPLPTSVFNVLPSPPTDLLITESLYLITPSIVGARVTVSWSGDAFYYIVQYARDDDNPVVATTSENSLDIQPAQPGTYEITVTAVNALGLRSLPAPLTAIIFGLAGVPEDVSGFELAALSGYAYLTWNSSTDLDVLVGGHMHIRYTPELVSPDWSSAVDIGPMITGTSTSVTLPLLAGTYMAKWVDGSDVESENAVSITTDAANIIALNFVAEAEESPTFAGAKVNVGVSGGGLTLESGETIGQQDLISDIPLISAIGGGFASEGTYYFANVIDLGSIQTARLLIELAVTGFDGLDLISYRPLVSTWASIIGTLVNDVGCTIYVRTTNDNPQLSPATWSAWQPFFVGEWTARAFEFKAVLTSDFITHNIRVTTLNVIVDMPDRVQAAEDVVSDAGATQVTFSLPFMASPALGITAQNMQTGDYFTINSKDEDGFNITFRNAAGTAVSRTFDWLAKGY